MYTLDWFELNNGVYEKGELRKCNKCEMIRYSDKYCERGVLVYTYRVFLTLQ